MVNSDIIRESLNLFPLKNMTPSFKDRLLDLSVHHWIHLAAAVCIGVLFYQNTQQESLIEQQASESRVLFRLAESSYFGSVREILTEVMQKHNLEYFSSGSHYATSERPGFITEDGVTYTFTLTEEKGRELLELEPQLRATMSENFSRMQDLQPEWQLRVYEGWDQAATVLNAAMDTKQPPPGKKWYTIDVRYAFRKLAGDQ